MFDPREERNWQVKSVDVIAYQPPPPSTPSPNENDGNKAESSESQPTPPTLSEMNKDGMSSLSTSQSPLQSKFSSSKQEEEDYSDFTAISENEAIPMKSRVILRIQLALPDENPPKSACLSLNTMYDWKVGKQGCVDKVIDYVKKMGSKLSNHQVGELRKMLGDAIKKTLDDPTLFK